MTKMLNIIPIIQHHAGFYTSHDFYEQPRYNKKLQLLLVLKYSKRKHGLMKL